MHRIAATASHTTYRPPSSPPPPPLTSLAQRPCSGLPRQNHDDRQRRRPRPGWWRSGPTRRRPRVSRRHAGRRLDVERRISVPGCALLSTERDAPRPVAGRPSGSAEASLGRAPAQLDAGASRWPEAPRPLGEACAPSPASSSRSIPSSSSPSSAPASAPTKVLDLRWSHPGTPRRRACFRASPSRVDGAAGPSQPVTRCAAAPRKPD